MSSLVTSLWTSQTVNVLQLMKEDEDTVPEPLPGPQETHPTGGRRINGKTTASGEDHDQVRGQGSRVVKGDGKRPRVGNETRRTPLSTWTQK